jgi:hypothetical protein
MAAGTTFSRAALVKPLKTAAACVLQFQQVGDEALVQNLAGCCVRHRAFEWCMRRQMLAALDVKLCASVKLFLWFVGRWMPANAAQLSLKAIVVTRLKSAPPVHCRTGKWGCLRTG